MTRSIGFAGLRGLQSDIRLELARLSGPAQTVSATPPAPASGAQATPVDDGSWKRFGIIGGVIAVIIAGIWISNSGSTSDSTGAPVPIQTSAASSTGEAYAPKSAPAEPVPSSDDITEEMPPEGLGLRLTANQVAYCLAEDVRLEAAKGRVDTGVEGQVDAFNAAVRSFNARCGEYKFLPADRQRAEAYLDYYRATIELDGARRVIRETRPAEIYPRFPEPSAAGNDPGRPDVADQALSPDGDLPAAGTEATSQ